MPQEMSDADVFGPDVHSLVTAAADRYNIPREILHNVAHTESGYNQSAVSPKGAVGVMQLMPGTARDLGVDPTDAAQNVDGGARYLKAQHDRFGDWRLAAAAYNAGPSAVEKHGGVPPYPETQKYVDAVAPQTEMSDADVFGASPQAAPPAAAAPTAAQAPAPSPAAAPPVARPAPAPLPARPNPTIAQDAVSGFAQPFVNLGHDVMQNYRAKIAQAQAPAPSLLDAGRQALTDVGTTGHILGDALTAIPSAVTGAFVRPAARAITNNGPTPYAPGGYSLQGGRLAFRAPQALSGDQAQAANESLLNTALSGARAAAPGVTAAIRARPMTLDQVAAAKDAAYAKVDASGFKFPQSDIKSLASDIATVVADKGGPSGARLYPAATAMSDRITALAHQPDGVPLSQLDSLRSDIYGALVKPGDRESPIGTMMRQKIDALINGSGAPNIQEARALNTQYSKMQAITDKLDSAGLRSASTYSGGNYPNAVRQSLRPLVDPTSTQQIGNLSPAETTALRSAVTGTTGQNATRYASKFLTNKFVQVPASLMTHGIATPIMEAAGALLNKAGEKQTAGAVQKVLDLISAGGQARQAPVYPTLALGGRPAPPILSGQGLIGGSALATLPARMSSARANANKR